MNRFFLFSVAACLAGACAAEEPLKTSEAELLSKLFELSLSAQSGHDPAPKAAEALSDVEYRAICRDLEDVSGIDLSRNNTRVRVVGEIVDVSDWSLYRRVVKRYSGVISDYVVFRPGPQLIDSLRQQITSLGFEFEKTAAPEKPGVVALAYEAGTLRLEGWFLSQADVDSVRAVVATRSWLSTEPEPADGRVPCELRLKVVDRLIDVGVVFVQVTKKDAEKFGNLATSKGKILDFHSIAQFSKAFKDFVPTVGGSGEGEGNGGYVRVSSSLDAVLQASAESGMFVARSSGHTTLDTNDMDKRSKFHKGGKMILKISGEVSGGDIEEVEYGFTIDCLGKFLRKDELALDLKLEQSSKPEQEANSTDYDQKKIDLNTHITCRLGQTVILSGAHETSDNEKGPSGWMFLRKVPVLSWFFAEGSEQRSDEHLLILVSPTLLDSPVQLAEKPSAENEKLEDEVKPVLKKDVEDTVGLWRWYDVLFFWKWCP